MMPFVRPRMRNLRWRSHVRPSMDVVVFEEES